MTEPGDLPEGFRCLPDQETHGLDDMPSIEAHLCAEAAAPSNGFGRRSAWT
jgi:hypothetical protein